MQSMEEWNSCAFDRNLETTSSLDIGKKYNTEKVAEKIYSKIFT